MLDLPEAMASCYFPDTWGASVERWASTRTELRWGSGVRDYSDRDKTRAILTKSDPARLEARRKAARESARKRYAEKLGHTPRTYTRSVPNA